ncbi:ALP1-like protein [Tanacetum coccineum]|uniref:ALP1-like protein n=1 Tax=Tanacetum coccineum TaxID=301880 RepID=A0ABQ5F4V1_9ASTR
MSDSSFFDSSDLDDIAEYEMIMEINNEDQDEVEAVRMRRYINRERDVAEERLMPEFLRKPTLADIQNLYAAHNRIHGFPGMLGSIDCMHWEWVNCPKSWHDQYGRGANNDITVLHHSPLFDDLLADNEPVAPYVVNGQPFDKGYYLQMVFTLNGQRLSNHSLLQAMKKTLCLNGVKKVPGKMLKGHLVPYKDDGVLLLNLRVLGL